LAAYGDAQTLRAVIALGAPLAVDAKLEQTLGDYDAPTTALDAAAIRGDPEILKVILQARAPWTRAQFGEGLLRAAQRGRMSIVGPLITAGADPLYVRPGRRSRDRGAYIGPGRALRTIIMNAAESGASDVVETILRSRPDVNAREEYGWTALHFVATPYGSTYPEPPSLDRARVVELLLAAGADVNARNDAGATPLAVSDRFLEVTTALKRAGAK
jgi:hypothetical protein